jgi:hypothetical protein
MRGPIRIGITFVAACLCTQAQWLNQPMAGAPRTPEGKVNLTGPVPRLNGKPDLSGIWQVEAEPRGPGGLFGLGESPNSKYFRDILSDFKPGEEPLQPAGVEILRKHGQPGVVGPSQSCLPDGVPHADLLPEPFKIIQTPGVILMLYEVETTFRQIFTDGRKQLTDPQQPSWMGYSVGKWEGANADTLVVDTVGFNDLSWLDARGHGHSEDMRVEERFHRRDFGHLEVGVTITDPKTFTRPVTIQFVEELLPDTDLLEHYCLEAEKDAAHLPGRAPR